ncbi:MAG: response regulator [Chloroflexi bacterium]|nr:response regulator [Chloroflexota bacterium]
MAEKILIVDDDLDTLRLVGLMLQRQGYHITAANNGEQGLLKAAEESPDLILLDVMMPDMDGYEVAQRLRQDAATANIPILMFTAKSQLDDKVTGFEAGADDYLTKPTHPSELQAHVKALLARAIKAQQVGPTTPLERNADVVGVLAARGGFGVSTLAVNLASSLHRETNDDVVVAELIPGKGTLGRDLGITELKGLVEILTSTPNEITLEKVKEALVPHASGLHLLLASDQPSDCHLIESLPQYEILFTRLTSLARFLVLDFGSGLPRLSQKLLGKCDQVIVVVEGMTNSIAHTRALLNDILGLGVDKKKIMVVLNNRIRSDMLLPWGRVQDDLEHSLTITLTPAPELFTQATRMHTPAVAHQPESLTGQQFAKLSTIIMEREAQGQ